MMKNYKKFILIFFPFLLFSQTELFEKNKFIVENDTLRYRILAPLDYDANENIQYIFFYMVQVKEEMIMNYSYFMDQIYS